ncbi:MAG: TolC family protein [Bacteroidales bacterium]|nr:TolC family protein [Bacteroidales bacterium]
MKFLLLLTLMLGAAPEVGQQTDPVADLDSALVLSLEDAIKVALSENLSVKVADKDIWRAKYAKRGTYASLFPQVDGSAAYQRTIKKQVMYMDFDLGSLGGDAGQIPGGSDAGTEQGAGTKAGDTPSKKEGFEVGRWNTWNAGITAAMPLVNAQLWKSISISGDEVELAVEKARGSRLGTVSSVKQAYYDVLLAKAANEVYEKSYANAKTNLEFTQARYNADKASEMELLRAKTTVANVVPELYNSRNQIGLALWQLKAVMGVDLDMNLDVQGSLSDYAQNMLYDIYANDDFSLEGNSTLRQLDIQLVELKKSVELNALAYVPTLALAFNYSINSMNNDFNFKEYNWTPYSYVGLSLSIPIFSGTKRLQAVKQSKVQLEQAKLMQQETERNLRVAIKSCLYTMENSMNSFYAAQSAVESAQKGYDISSNAYQVGRSTLIELNDALLALAQSELAEWQSIYSFLVAKNNLEEQLGKDFIE